jgi:hypothetical protein
MSRLEKVFVSSRAPSFGYSRNRLEGSGGVKSLLPGKLRPPPFGSLTGRLTYYSNYREWNSPTSHLG